MNNSKQKDTILVKVCRIDDGSNEYVVEYQDKIYRVAQLPYQRELDTPSELRCIVEYSREGIHIKQDLEYLIGEFYKKGDVAEFKIQRTATDYHLLQEEHGFTAKIAKELVPNPALTPILRCRITGIYSKGVKVELVQKLLADTSGFSLTQNILKDYIGDTPWNNESLRLLLLDNNINLDLFDSECHKWLVKMAEGMGSEELVTNLKNLREHLLNALESSMMLDECADINERTLIENRFSDMIEQTSYYSYAIDFVNKGNAKGEIDAILGRLDTSCFLYHPNKNFYILLCIFLLDFDLMDENMPRILNILRGHNIAIWKRKPFRTLWIKLLEYYISTNYKRPDLLISDNETVRVMIQALIMQLNLSDGGQSSLFDATLNRTILYRLCSRMNVLEPQKLVDEALFNLISDSNVNTLYSIDSDDSELLANIISNQVSDVLNANTDSVCYNTEKAKILIKSGNISISAADVTNDNCYIPQFSKQALWHNLTLKLSESPAMEIQRDNSNSIRHYKQLWSFINKSIFDTVREKPVKVVKRLLEGAEVTIIITRKLPGDSAFECKVVDEGYDDAKGKISIEDIVPYYPGSLTVAAFEYGGRPLKFRAEVSVDDDGEYIFKMKDLIFAFMEEYRDEKFNINSRIVCQIMNPKEGATRMPAVSTDGLSISVDVEDGVSLDILRPGNVVEVYQPKPGYPPFINATYVHDVEHNLFSLSDAFHNLMENYANNEVYFSEDEEENNAIDVIDASYVNELMNIIEAYSSCENDYIKAYNYISFCRVISKIINSDREQYYIKRLSLIELLNDFAINNTFTDESLSALCQEHVSSFSQDSVLHREFLQMKIVSWLNSDEHYDELYKLSMNREDVQLQNLASLVMSHNMIKKAGGLDMADSILNKIRGILKLRSNETDKKFYGKETFNTEFKTSIVYPENTMHANIVAQTTKILSEICAFLNAEGGKLYLGVNDQGYEFGLAEDLKFKQFNNNTDHYEDYVNNQIATQLSQEAAHYVRTSWDDKVKSHVLIIEITPCPNPVSLGGDYYERIGKSCRKINKEYLPIFIQNRKQWAKDHNLTTKDEIPEVPVEVVQPVQPVAPVKSKVIVESPKVEKIQTSRTRKNVLHSYEDDFIPVVAYLCIFGDNEYKIIDDDDYCEDDYKLELAIHDDEQEHWLILVYENGAVSKVSISKLLQKEKGHVFRRYFAKKLIYASIAQDSDELVSGLIDIRDSKRIRYDDISNIPEANMQDAGTTMCDTEYKGVHYIEIVPHIEKGVALNPKRQDLGTFLKGITGQNVVNSLPGLIV